MISRLASRWAKVNAAAWNESPFAGEGTQAKAVIFQR